ncbi:MAG: hypothetical protein K940chlam3_00528 [Chlamydiae bacterium]|nr:hypothetical protein [Chlamydiota bacterium]
MEPLLYSLIASSILLLGGFISTVLKISKSGVSFMQHFAAGVIFAAVSVELIPILLKSHQKLDIVIGFLLGVGAMLLIRTLGQKYETTPIGMITGIGVDLWIDGILIGLSFIAAKESGIIITTALCIEVAFLGMALLPTMKNKGISLGIRVLTILGLALLLPFGTATGLEVIHNLPETFFEGTLAFGVAALLYLVTEELLFEAHQEVDSVFGSAAFFIGFLIILLIH